MSIAWIVPGAFQMTAVKAQTCLEPLKISEGLSDRDIFAHMHILDALFSLERVLQLHRSKGATKISKSPTQMSD